MLVENDYHTTGCSCGVPLVTRSMGQTCPACGLVMPEVEFFEQRAGEGDFHPFPQKPKALYSNGNGLRSALKLKIKNVGTDAKRKDRNYCVILDTVSQALGFSDESHAVQRFAWFYYTKIRHAEHLKHSQFLLAAAVYAAAREIHSCLSFRKVIDAFEQRGFHVTVRGTLRIYARYRKYLPNANIPPERYLFKIMADLCQIPAVQQVIADAGLDMDEVFVVVVRRSIRLLKEHPSLPGRAPIRCAAAIYLAFKLRGVHVGAPLLASIVEAKENRVRHVATLLGGE